MMGCDSGLHFLDERSIFTTSWPGRLSRCRSGRFFTSSKRTPLRPFRTTPASGPPVANSAFESRNEGVTSLNRSLPEISLNDGTSVPGAQSFRQERVHLL